MFIKRVLIAALTVFAISGCTINQYGYPSMAYGGSGGMLSGEASPAFWYGYSQGKSTVPTVQAK